MQGVGVDFELGLQTVPAVPKPQPGEVCARFLKKIGGKPSEAEVVDVEKFERRRPVVSCVEIFKRFIRERVLLNIFIIFSLNYKLNKIFSIAFKSK